MREKILSLLREDASATRQKLAEKLPISYQAVQKHIHQMQKDGLVRPALVVSTEEWRKAHRKFWVFIETAPPDQVKRRSGAKPNNGSQPGGSAGDGASSPSEGERSRNYQEDICRRISDELIGGHRESAIMLGEIDIIIGSEWDIILTLLAQDMDEVGRFVTYAVRGIPGVVRTRTVWSLRRDGMAWIPHIHPEILQVKEPDA
jgi:DNA-binding Lrp family transcriptional regulator